MNVQKRVCACFTAGPLAGRMGGTPGGGRDEVSSSFFCFLFIHKTRTVKTRHNKYNNPIPNCYLNLLIHS